MITVNDNKINTINQISYENLINSISFHQVTCTCWHKGTFIRHVNLIKSEEKITINKDMRRYEREHINEVWCGDSSVGPYLNVNGKKKRTYVISLIDDASRMIVGINIFFNDNYINLMSVMKTAVTRFGRPKILNFDNGSTYKNKQIDLLAANEPLRQRITMNFNLESLTKEETSAYIKAKLSGAKCTMEVFNPNAYEAIANASNGIPRIINKICNSALMIGASKNAEYVDADIIMAAVNDMELA